MTSALFKLVALDDITNFKCVDWQHLLSCKDMQMCNSRGCYAHLFAPERADAGNAIGTIFLRTCQQLAGHAA